MTRDEREGVEVWQVECARFSVTVEVARQTGGHVIVHLEAPGGRKARHAVSGNGKLMSIRQEARRRLRSWGYAI